MVLKAINMDVKNRIIDRIEDTMSQIASYLSSAKAFQKDEYVERGEITIHQISRLSNMLKC